MLLCLLNYFSPHSFFSFLLPFPPHFLFSDPPLSIFTLVSNSTSLFLLIPQYFLIFFHFKSSLFLLYPLSCPYMLHPFLNFLTLPRLFSSLISFLLLLSSSYMLILSSPSPWHILILDSSNNFFQFIASLFLPFFLISHSFVITPPPTLRFCSFSFLFTLLAHYFINFIIVPRRLYFPALQ